MFEVFEPAEKKLELRLRAGSPSLRCLPAVFWREVVAQAQAEVVAARHGDHASAFLLSESSLFVFDESLTMITCGRSTLAAAGEHLLRALGTEAVEAFCFQRRREQTELRQRSSFESDVARLSRYLPTGTLDQRAGASARLQRFVYEGRGASPEPCSRLELYMFEVAEPEPRLVELFAGFELDEHRFEPEGHSLNAVRQGAHRAIHVSPAPGGTYAGLDASDPSAAALDRLCDQSLSLFRPRRWEAVLRPSGASPSYVERSVEARVSYL